MLGRLAANRDGNVAVEFALLLPLLILILGGVIDFGRAFYDRMALESAARSAVQYARQSPSDSAGIQLAALGAGGVPSTATVDALQVFCECPDGSSVGCNAVCASGGTVLRFLSVTVRENFETMFPYPGVSSPLALAGSATIRVQ
ncbi:TadE/TadG family type IV pilus assembly protein [Azospirillum sp. sgz301742]